MFNVFNPFDLSAGLEKIKTNYCITVGSDGADLRGYIAGQFGSLYPNVTNAGVPITRATWDIVTGDFLIQFNGGIQIPNLVNLLITHYLVQDGNIAKWDDALMGFTFNDLDLVQKIGTNTSCFHAEILYDHMIAYNFSDKLTSDVRYIDNIAPNVAPSFLGNMKSGRSVALSGDGLIEVPINYALGTELDGYDGAMVDKTSNSNLRFIQFNCGLVVEANKTYRIAIDYDDTINSIINAGTSDGFQFYTGSTIHFIRKTITPFVKGGVGTAVFEIKMLSSYVGSGTTSAYAWVTSMAEGDVAKFGLRSMKEIQSTQGQITYYDFMQKKHIGIGENGTELVENGDFSNGLNGWGIDNINWAVENEKAVKKTTANASFTFISDPAKDGKRYGATYTPSGNNVEFLWLNEIQQPINDGSIPQYFTKVASKKSIYYSCGTHDNGSFDNLSIIEALPLSTHYRLENVTFNNLIVLWDRSFTQTDRDLMDLEPELVVRWALGEDVGFSIGVIGANDKVYVCSEGGAYLLEINYVEGSELNIWDNLPRGTNIFTDNGNGSYHLTVNDSLDGVYIRIDLVQGVLYSIDYKITNATVDNGIRVVDGVTHNGIYGHISHLQATTKNVVFRFSDLVVGQEFDVELTAKEVLSDYLTIQGTYTRQTQQPQGLQTLALELNDAGVPIAVSSTVSFLNNSTGFIDTQWKPNTDVYTIVAELNKIDGTQETRKLVHDALGADEYYINGVLEAVPTLPDPTKTLRLTSSAVIGAADQIKSTLKFDAYSVKV